eukprot:358130-Chlamydomonas_euryale.AAC.7
MMPEKVPVSRKSTSVRKAPVAHNNCEKGLHGMTSMTGQHGRTSYPPPPSLPTVGRYGSVRYGRRHKRLSRGPTAGIASPHCRLPTSTPWHPASAPNHPGKHPG